MQSQSTHDARVACVGARARRWGGTALADAVREGHASIAELLRSKGGELLYDEAKASGDLCEFARQGDVKSVQMLLSSGCSANAADCASLPGFRSSAVLRCEHLLACKDVSFSLLRAQMTTVRA